MGIEWRTEEGKMGDLWGIELGEREAVLLCGNPGSTPN